MNRQQTPLQPRLGILFLALVALLTQQQAMGDASIGIDPYGEGSGFDRPSEATWGGWSRCQAGTLFAEWDQFVDASYGTDTDGSGAPLAADGSKAQCGTQSAFLAWSTEAPAPRFAYSQGTYLYNLSNGGQGGETRFRLEATGDLAPGLTRVALQIETRSYPVGEATLALNGQKPSLSAIRLEKDTTLNGRAAKVYHQLVIWNLPKAPEALRITFVTEPHTVVQLVTLDAGPLNAPEGPGAITEEARKVLVDLPAEAVDAETVRLLHLQKPQLFKAAWSGGDLLFTQTPPKQGAFTQSLVGGIKALVYDESEGQAGELWVDLYRKDPIADIRIASCALKPTKIRWARVNLGNVLTRVGTAVYRIDLRQRVLEGESGRSMKAVGVCDIDPGTEGVQPGVPALIEGDYGRLRRS